jgi:hypothetical protein
MSTLTWKIIPWASSIDSIIERQVGDISSNTKVSQTTYMDHWLREFDKLLLDNALLKVQIQALINKNSKWKEWW